MDLKHSFSYLFREGENWGPKLLKIQLFDWREGHTFKDAWIQGKMQGEIKVLNERHLSSIRAGGYKCEEVVGVKSA
jgi:hypothetical protein